MHTQIYVVRISKNRFLEGSQVKEQYITGGWDGNFHLYRILNQLGATTDLTLVGNGATSFAKQ